MTFEEQMIEQTAYLKFYDLVQLVDKNLSTDVWDLARVIRCTNSLRIEWTFGNQLPYIDVCYGDGNARFASGDEIFSFVIDNETHIDFITDKLRTLKAENRAKI